MNKDVIIALNMQKNYFSAKGSSFVGPIFKERQQKIVDYLASLKPETTELYYTRDIRSPEDSFWSFTTTQCVVGSTDIFMLDSLPKGNPLIITTSRPSALYLTPLLSELRKHTPSKVTLVGAETDSSVLFTAAELRFRGYRVVVPEALVVAKDEYVHGASIAIMADNLGVEVI